MDFTLKYVCLTCNQMMEIQHSELAFLDLEETGYWAHWMDGKESCKDKCMTVINSEEYDAFLLLNK